MSDGPRAGLKVIGHYLLGHGDFPRFVPKKPWDSARASLKRREPGVGKEKLPDHPHVWPSCSLSIVLFARAGQPD